MEQKTYLKTAAVLFGIIGLMHLVRSVAGSSMEIGGTYIPVWASWIAVIVLGFLSYQGFELSR